MYSWHHPQKPSNVWAANELNYPHLHMCSSISLSHYTRDTSRDLLNVSSSDSSIGCELRLIRRRSQVRIPLSPTLVWTCQKKKEKKKKGSTRCRTQRRTSVSCTDLFNISSFLFFLWKLHGILLWEHYPCAWSKIAVFCNFVKVLKYKTYLKAHKLNIKMLKKTHKLNIKMLKKAE